MKDNRQLLVLGIDQGGSKTMASVADSQGRILGVGHAAGSVHGSLGMNHAMAQIKASALAACAQAGVKDFSRIKAVGAGITGADFPSEYEQLTQQMRLLFPGSDICVENDVMIGMRAGTQAQWGAALSVGTGTNIAVRSPQGEKYIFGYYIADPWQGAAAIGERALRSVFDAEAGIGQATALTEHLLKEHGHKTVDALLQAYITSKEDFGEIKELSLLVDEYALKGDAVCTQIIRRFARQYGEFLTAGLRRLDMLHLQVEVVLSGSVLKSRVPTWREELLSTLRQQVPGAYLVDSPYEPVVGGVLSALELIHHSGQLPARIHESLQATAHEKNLHRELDGDLCNPSLR